MARLGNLVEQIRGVSYKPEDVYDELNENSVALLRANNIKDGQLNFDDVIYVDKKKVRDNQLLKAGDILICTSSGSKELVGKAAYVQKDLSMTFGAFCKVVRAQKIRSDYLGHFFNSPYYRHKISNASAGANINNIRNEHIDELEILLPTIDRQKYVAVVLDKLTGLISLRKQQLAKLEALVKAHFVEMFGDPEINPFGWPVTQLCRLVTVEPQNGLYKPQSDYVQDGRGVPILRIDAFYNGKVTSLKSLKRLICSDVEIQRYLLREDDIVINRVNSIEYLGKCAHIKGMSESTVFESNMMRLHLNEKKIDAEYATYLLCSQYIYNQILQKAKKAINQASINQRDVQSFSILLPPLQLQRQFATFVAQTDKSKLTIQQSLDKLEVLKKSLMQEYFG